MWMQYNALNDKQDSGLGPEVISRLSRLGHARARASTSASSSVATGPVSAQRVKERKK